MARRLGNTESGLAKWAWGVALFCAHLLVLAVVLHRFDMLPTPPAVNLLTVALTGGALAGLISLVGLRRIWQRGLVGAGRAVMALLITIAMFALPAWYLPNLFLLPQVIDVSTDRDTPLPFRALAKIRANSASAATSPDEEENRPSNPIYPDVVTLTLERSNVASFELVKESAQELGWDIVAETKPTAKRRTGWIEASARTLVMGYVDDIVVRVAGNENKTRIDMRSASRYGKHDLGTNATRIIRFFNEIKTRIAKAEAAQAEYLARERARMEQEKRHQAALAKAEAERIRRLEEQRRQEAERRRRARLLNKAIRRQQGLSPKVKTRPSSNEEKPQDQAAKSKKKAKLRPRKRRRKRRRPTWDPFANQLPR